MLASLSKHLDCRFGTDFEAEAPNRTVPRLMTNRNCEIIAAGFLFGLVWFFIDRTTWHSES